MFRSSVGLVAAVLGLRLLGERIEPEETVLASRFGDACAAQRRRSWRLFPWLYRRPAERLSEADAGPYA